MTRTASILLHAVLGVAAVAAGLAFARRPDGGDLGMEATWLEGSPFTDFRIPGLFLLLVIAPANVASALLLARRHRGGPYLSLATGLLLVVWLAIQTAILGLRHWSQLLWWAVFPLVALLGAMQVHRQRREEHRG
ncbi:MAG: hypothetical protein AB7I38_10710 [Dehalococcoidia bacterium]